MLILKKAQTTAILCLFISLSSYAQKLKRTYYDFFATRLKEEYYFTSSPKKLEIKNGAYKLYDQSGVLVKSCNYKNDAYNGTFYEYINLDGKAVTKAKATYLNGQLNGPLYQYDYDFKKNKSYLSTVKNFVNGKLSGPYVEYESDGSKCVFKVKNGMAYGKNFCYFPSGKVSVEGNYIDGKKEGMTKMFAPTGEVEMICFYKDDMMHGEAFYYYKSGNVKQKAYFAENRKEGAWSWYDKNEKIIEKTIYTNDDEIGNAYLKYLPNGEYTDSIKTLLNIDYLFNYFDSSDYTEVLAIHDVISNTIQDNVKAFSSFCIAWAYFFGKQYDLSIAASREGQRFLNSDDILVLRLNLPLAHSLLLNNQYEEAMVIYEANFGKKLENDELWEKRVLRNLQTFKKENGIVSPNLDKAIITLKEKVK